MSIEYKNIDPFLLNKEIAYVGNIGKKREDFCMDFINKKRQITEFIENMQIITAMKNGEVITCKKGCNYCCYFYMHASLQECEAIVYYLYHNEKVYHHFLNNYDEWRIQLKKNGDIFQNCARLWYKSNTQGANMKAIKDLEVETIRYRDQNLPCPFLDNGSCSIYEVRPYQCVGRVATTPPDWCYNTEKNKPRIYKNHIPELFDKSFYYNNLTDYILTFFPITVHDILQSGYKMIGIISGIAKLEEQAINDTSVRNIINNITR